ncbi:MAG: helix-turn-helix transcriptional regulator [Oscillospiraceae bacterium]|jgi:DNA-binding CsgD family transcriptional regulator|nr:helix-turn-helix transcriptional regulator [Oscillospiraceae bacterium]
MFSVVFVAAGFLFLSLAGIFNAGEHESRVWLEAEMAHLTNGVTTDFSKLSLQSVSLAEQLVRDVHIYAQRNGIAEKDLQSNPELIEGLLSEQMGSLLTVLKNSQCSGVFIILEATVTPEAENAADSRAGIFLKRTETNNITALASKIHFLRGPANIARANGVELLGQWQMEFDVAYADFFDTAITTAKENNGVSLSRLYYWSGRFMMKRNSEYAMLLCVPLIANDGTVFGLCGMEVSSMLFKRNYSPDNIDFPRVFSTLSPSKGSTIETGGGLIAGNSYLNNRDTGELAEISNRKGLYSYYSDNGETYIGLQGAFRLYPAGSPFTGDEWTLALLMPAEDWENAVSEGNTVLYIIGFAFLVISLFAATVVSKRYIHPVVQALEAIKTDDHSAMPKTQIAEIDDLFEFLAKQDAAREAAAAREGGISAEEVTVAPDLSLYLGFVERIGTLTKAERMTFDLYAQGFKAGEIAERMFVSINTIRFHNRNIYSKLGVSSAKEMMVYVRMLNDAAAKKSG